MFKDKTVANITGSIVMGFGIVQFIQVLGLMLVSRLQSDGGPTWNTKTFLQQLILMLIALLVGRWITRGASLKARFPKRSR